MRRVFRSAALGMCVALACTTACKGKDENKDDKSAEAKKGTTEAPKTDDKAGDKAAMAAADATAKRYLECVGFARDKKYEDLATCYTEDATSTQMGFLPEVVAKGRSAIVEDVKKNEEAFTESGFNMRLLLVKDAKELVSVGLFFARQEGDDGGDLMKIGIMSANHSTMGDAGAVSAERVYMDQATLLGQIGQMPENMPTRPAADPDPAPPVVVVAEGTETEAKNLAVITEVLAAMNKHDAAAVMGYYTDDTELKEMAYPEDVTGKAKVQGLLTEFFGMSKDLAFKTDWAFAAGDYVVDHVTVSGTNNGPLPGGGEATGEKFETIQLDVYRLREGKITQHMIFSNGYAFAAQLGLVPDPSDPGEEGGEEDK